MEKPKLKPKKKPKKKTIQITYPAPYSSSWTPDVQPVLMKNSVGRSASVFQRSKRPPSSARAWSQQFPADRPDPTAPHLKYGVFRNRKGAPPKPLPNVNTLQKVDRFQRISSPTKQTSPRTAPVKMARRPSKNISLNAPMKSVDKVPALSELPPKLLLVNKEVSNTKELHFSKVAHMDIKPKIVYSGVPSFCPTPHFRNMQRRLAMSPTKYRTNEVV